MDVAGALCPDWVVCDTGILPLNAVGNLWFDKIVESLQKAVGVLYSPPGDFGKPRIRCSCDLVCA